MRVHWPVTQHWIRRGPHIEHLFCCQNACLLARCPALGNGPIKIFLPILFYCFVRVYRTLPRNGCICHSIIPFRKFLVVSFLPVRYFPSPFLPTPNNKVWERSQLPCSVAGRGLGQWQTLEVARGRVCRCDHAMLSQNTGFCALSEHVFRWCENISFLNFLGLGSMFCSDFILVNYVFFCL
jgi:hypothetical protein